jgi:predicted MFS family arabinose efflux permease
LTVKAYHSPKPHKVTPEKLIQSLREPGFMAVMIGVFLFTFGLFCVLTYITVQAISTGMDPSLAQYLPAILNAARYLVIPPNPITCPNTKTSLFGRLASGFAADKYGKYNVFIVVCYITGIVFLALWLPASGNGAIIKFAVLFGFFSGSYVSLIRALVVQISPPKEIGFRTGLVFSLPACGGLKPVKLMEKFSQIPVVGMDWRYLRVSSV